MGASIYLLPHQERSIQSPENFPHIRWHFLLGGYGCVDGDSELLTVDGLIKIKDFNGGYIYSFDSNGNMVKAKAGTPVYYKPEPMYKVELENGKSITCTKAHKLLTEHGWMSVEQLVAGQHRVYAVQHLSSSDIPRHTSSGTCLSGSCEGVQYSKKITQDSLDGYPVCHHSDGEQLRVALSTDLTSAPSQDDAQKHILKSLHEDVHDTECKYNHSYPQCDHHCKNHSTCHKHHLASHEECCTSGITSEHISEVYQEYAQSLLNSDQKQSVPLSAPQEQDVHAQSFVSYSSETSLITNITYLGETVYYDLNVPGYHNYIANGIIHHNCGKTTCLVFTLLYWVGKLQGVKDDGGKYARIIVGGYTYAHLEQTVMIDLLSYLDQSKTIYRYDTKNHIMYIGTIEIIFAQLSEPDRIFGQSVYCFVNSTKILTRDKMSNILEVSIEDVSEGDEVLTRHGWKKVLAKHDNGYRECMRVGNALCTPDHRFAVGNDWVEARYITSETPLWKYNLKDVKLCQNLADGTDRLSQILKNLTESSTTDIQILNQAVNESITGVKTIKHIMLRCGKNTMEKSQRDTVYTILTAIHSIMTLVISNFLVTQNIISCMLKYTDRQDIINVLNTVRQCLKQLKHAWRMLSERETALSVVKNIKESIRQSTAQMTVVKQLIKKTMSDTPENVKIAPLYLRHLSEVLDSVVKNAEMLGHINMEKLLTLCVRQEHASSVARHLSALDRIRHKLAHLTVKTSREDRLYHVYDLTVEDCHEFFADGMLAHNCVLCDEIDELPEDTMIEAMKSVSQRCRQKLKGQRSNFIQSFSTAQGYKGFYRLYTHYKKNNISFVLIRALTKDNIYLPKEYIEDLEKSFTETERKVFMEGEFLSVSQGRVIPGFDWDKNFTDDDLDTKLYPREKVFIGMDFNTGYSRASAWVSRDGVMHCIKYWDFPDAMEAPNVFRYDFPEQDIFWLPDVTSKDSFPQFARALRQNNIHIIYRTKSPLVEDSCFFISSLCYQGRIMVHSQASNVAEAFAQASRDKNNKIPKGVGESSPIHTIDGARYATSYMGLVLPEYKDIRRSLMSHIATYRNIIETAGDDDEDVKTVGSGYTQIEGRAYLR